MSEGAIIVFCWIALAVTALMLLGGLAVGAAYNQELGAPKMFAAASPLIGVAVLLVLLPRTSGIVWGLVLLGLALAAVALIGFFTYRLAIDGGDAVLWTPPLLLGFGLLALVLGLGRKSQSRGDA